jgi:hypothetical protein
MRCRFLWVRIFYVTRDRFRFHVAVVVILQHAIRLLSHLRACSPRVAVRAWHPMMRTHKPVVMTFKLPKIDSPVGEPRTLTLVDRIWQDEFERSFCCRKALLNRMPCSRWREYEKIRTAEFEATQRVSRSVGRVSPSVASRNPTIRVAPLARETGCASTRGPTKETTNQTNQFSKQGGGGRSVKQKPPEKPLQF